MKIEVCINRLEDVQRIQSLAVDRIELCIELACGGVTPSLAMVEQALALSAIPIHVLVRPRSGDFMYSDVTLSGMEKTIEQLHDLGVAGIVTGALTKDKNLPIAVLQSFRSIVSNGALYFHRAFDEVNAPENALKQLIALGYDGVLTSGQKATAIEGIEHLDQWKEQTGQALTILPGSGINASNCLEFNNKGFEWIHLSSKKTMAPSYDSLFSTKQYQLDLAELDQVIELVKS